MIKKEIRSSEKKVFGAVSEVRKKTFQAGRVGQALVYTGYRCFKRVTITNVKVGTELFSNAAGMK